MLQYTNYKNIEQSKNIIYNNPHNDRFMGPIHYVIEIDYR